MSRAKTTPAPAPHQIPDPEDQGREQAHEQKGFDRVRVHRVLRFSRTSLATGAEIRAPFFGRGAAEPHAELLEGIAPQQLFQFAEAVHRDDQFFPQLQNDLHPGDVDAEVPREVQDHLQPFKVIAGVEAGVALAAARREKPFALVHAKRLRMDIVHLRDGADREPLAANPRPSGHGSPPVP